MCLIFSLVARWDSLLNQINQRPWIKLSSFIEFAFAWFIQTVLSMRTISVFVSKALRIDLWLELKVDIIHSYHIFPTAELLLLII